MEEKLVSIVILNYNGDDFLENCIESIKSKTTGNYEIIVVDNASPDNSGRKTALKYSDCKFILNEENVGVPEGLNIGIKNSTGKFLILMNNDVIVTKGWLENFFSAFKKHGVALYQPKFVKMSDPNILDGTGDMINLFGFGFARDKGVKDKNQFKKIEKIGYASGTCLFTSSKVLDKIGLLDPFLFLYHDDLDLGWRAAQLGINSYFVPNVKILHAESYILKWSSKKFYWLERNRKYCILTHFSKNTYKKMRLTLLLVDCFVWIFYISKGFLFAKIKAELDIRKNKKQIEKRYLELENKKIISDEKLINEFPDKIFVPINVAKGNVNNSFNSIIEKLSIHVKKKILKKIN